MTDPSKQLDWWPSQEEFDKLHRAIGRNVVLFQNLENQLQSMLSKLISCQLPYAHAIALQTGFRGLCSLVGALCADPLGAPEVYPEMAKFLAQCGSLADRRNGMLHSHYGVFVGTKRIAALKPITRVRKPPAGGLNTNIMTDLAELESELESALKRGGKIYATVNASVNRRDAAASMMAPMADDTGIRHGTDRSRVNLDRDHEVRYWSKELNVTEEQLREAVRAIGPSTSAVRAYLQANKE